MKTMNKNLLCLQVRLFAIPAALLLTFSSCSKDSDDSSNNNNTIFKAALSGKEETPPNTSAATGTATLTYNETTKVFNLTVSHNVANANQAHIHKGAPGVAGPPVFTLTPSSPINYTSAPLDSIQRADLFAGNYYVNVHSPAYPNGEIRGQLVKQ